VDLPELLRSQAKRYRCAVCGQNMADCGINVLAQQGNRALVRVTCASCNDENLLQIIFQTEGIPQISEPITGDEMLQLHDLLSGHNGSFSELLKQS
jgi:hypothetical protein